MNQEKEITEGEKKFVQEALNEQEPIFVRWITKKKRTKVQQRLLAIGTYRVVSIKRASIGGSKQVRREGHLYDLEAIESSSPSQVVLKFRTFELDASGDEGIADVVINIVRTQLSKISFGFPKSSLPTLFILPTERIADIVPPEPGPAEGLLECYTAWCSYHKCEVSKAFCAFIKDVATGSNSHELALDQCSGIELKTEYSFDMNPVVSALRHNKFFSKIVLKDVPRKDAIHLFSETMRWNTTVQKIILSNLEATEGFTEFGEALKLNTQNVLSHVDLSNNQMRDKGVLGLATGFETFNHGLTVINLSNCGIGEKGFISLMRVFETNPTLSHSIVQLNVSHNPVGHRGSAALSSWISSMNPHEGRRSALKHLYAANCGLDVFVFFQAIRNSLMETLEVLDISENKVDKIASQAVTFLMENASMLNYVDLTSTSLSAESAFIILSSISNNGRLVNVELDISANNLGEEGASSIAKVLPSCTNIMNLKLRSNNFRSSGLVLVLKALAENSSIKGIDLSYNFRPVKNQECLKALGDVLTKHKTLETLILAGSEKFHIGKNFAMIFPLLGANKTLTALDMNGNKIGDRAAISLADALRTNTSIKYMTWDRNSVELGGFQAFASALKTNKTLLGVPPPIDDIETALNESKDKKRLRDKLTSVMNQIQHALAANRGEAPGPEFAIPTTSRRRVTYASAGPGQLPTVKTEEKKRRASTFNRRESLKLGSNLEYYESPEMPEDSDAESEIESPAMSPRGSQMSMASEGSVIADLPPPPPYEPEPQQLQLPEVDEDDMPPPPTPPPF